MSGLLGHGVAAMWCDVAAADRAEFDDWHAHEHLPERLRIPGFLRGTRWRSPSNPESVFMMYELTDLGVFSSAAYLERLNHPTSWSTRMMPSIRNMVRSPCRVSASAGAGVGREMLTVRLSPDDGKSDVLRRWLAMDIVPALAGRAGLVAAHLLESEAQPQREQTAEQRMRGGDAMADWVLIVTGCDIEPFAALLRSDFAQDQWQAHGAQPDVKAELFSLVHVMVPADLAV